MEGSAIQTTVDKIDGIVRVCSDVTRSDVDRINQGITDQALVLGDVVNIRIEDINITLTRYVSIIQYNALYHINHVISGGSIGLLLFIFGAIKVIKTIWAVTKVVVTIISIIKAFHIDDLLYKFWPWYADQVDKIRSFITDVSEALNWGVDGVMHLINAASGGISIYGGLTGKGEEWLQLQGLIKAEDTLKLIETYTTIGYKDPSGLLGKIFEVNERDTLLWFKQWNGENLDRIISVTDIAEKALTDAGDIGNELLAIREGMPKIIADNIPASIWSGLESFNQVIYDNILPTVSAINNKLDQVNNLLDKYSADLTQLGRRLTKPGDLLAGVDALPGYMKDTQEKMIGEVASREFEREADAGRLELSGDLEEFERIDQALSAPTPPPGFMRLESPERAAVTGIKAEVAETWILTEDY